MAIKRQGPGRAVQRRRVRVRERLRQHPGERAGARRRTFSAGGEQAQLHRSPVGVGLAQADQLAFGQRPDQIARRRLVDVHGPRGSLTDPGPGTDDAQRQRWALTPARFSTCWKCVFTALNTRRKRRSTRTSAARARPSRQRRRARDRRGASHSAESSSFIAELRPIGSARRSFTPRLCQFGQIYYPAPRGRRWPPISRPPPRGRDERRKDRVKLGSAGDGGRSGAGRARRRGIRQVARGTQARCAAGGVAASGAPCHRRHPPAGCCLRTFRALPDRDRPARGVPPAEPPTMQALLTDLLRPQDRALRCSSSTTLRASSSPPSTTWDASTRRRAWLARQSGAGALPRRNGPPPAASSVPTTACATPCVLLIETVDLRKVDAVYRQLYLRLQRAYEEIPGFRTATSTTGSSGDRIVATPARCRSRSAAEIRGRCSPSGRGCSTSSNDPSLQRLSAGQRLLLRVGPVNERHFSSKMARARTAAPGVRQRRRRLNAHRCPAFLQLARRTRLAARHRDRMARRRAGPPADLAARISLYGVVGFALGSTNSGCCRRVAMRRAAGQRRLRADAVRVRLPRQPALAAHQPMARRGSVLEAALTFVLSSMRWRPRSAAGRGRAAAGVAGDVDVTGRRAAGRQRAAQRAGQVTESACCT